MLGPPPTEATGCESLRLLRLDSKRKETNGWVVDVSLLNTEAETAGARREDDLDKCSRVLIDAMENSNRGCSVAHIDMPVMTAELNDPDVV